MRILLRNTTRFNYRAYAGRFEVMADGLHTGRFEPQYRRPVEYRGNINWPGGYATDNLFGINTNYSHVLVMDDPNAPIKEDGLIDWKGDTYEVVAVRPSINVLSVALRKRTKNHNGTGADDGECPCDECGGECE